MKAYRFSLQMKKQIAALTREVLAWKMILQL